MIFASPHPTPALSQLFRWCMLGAWGTLALVALLLAVEGVSTAAARSFHPAAAVMVVLFFAALALVSRWRRGSASADVFIPWQWAMLLLPTACLLLLAVAIASADVPPWTIAVAWLVIGCEEGLLLWRARDDLRRRASWFRSRRQERPSQAPDRETTITNDVALLTDELPATATQSQLRTRNPDGTEAISGTLRADFAPGERTVYVHVGFCPPLACVPKIEFEQTSGPEATIKLAQCLPHGARFDIRLQRSLSEAAQVELAFHAASGIAPTTAT